jgi:hypothetical protein
MKKIIFLISVFAVIFVSQVLAQGNLLVTPIRVIFQDAKTREDLNITNIGNDTAVYMISFLHYRMLQNGSFKEIQKTDTTINFADDYLRIFPRRVVLAPNESQTVRLQFRKNANMKAGEYRSHLYFRAEKNLVALGMKDPRTDSTKMSVRITPIFGISIPVIIRIGTLSNKISLSDVNLKSENDSISNLSFTINRTGNLSSYGNLIVTFVPAEGKAFTIGQSNGVGVYPELEKRDYLIPLHFKFDLKNKKGKIVIRYVNAADEKIELARTEYVL